MLYWMADLYRPFLVDLAIATLLAIATASLRENIERRLPCPSTVRRPLMAAIVMTLGLAFVLFGPILYFVVNIAFQIESISTFVGQLSNLKGMLEGWLEQLPPSLAFIKTEVEKLFYGFEHQQFTQDMINLATQMGKQSLLFLWDIVLILTFYFFAQLYGQDIIHFLGRVSPLSESDNRLIYTETSQVMGVVFYSSLVTAILEGALFGILVAFFGYDPIFFGISYGFASLVPVLGGVMMWGPLALVELSAEHYENAIVIALYSIIIISVIADTFVKPIIIQMINRRLLKASRHKAQAGEPVSAGINPLLIFFSIVAGLSAYGFWGVILGPAITALFISILKIYGMLKLPSTEES